MATKLAAAVKREHAYGGVGASQYVSCSCGWTSDSRVGRASVARERHRQHVAEMVGSAR